MIANAAFEPLLEPQRAVSVLNRKQLRKLPSLDWDAAADCVLVRAKVKLHQRTAVVVITLPLCSNLLVKWDEINVEPESQVGLI